jgi:hypothetical protein
LGGVGKLEEGSTPIGTDDTDLGTGNCSCLKRMLRFAVGDEFDGVAGI